MRIVSFAPEGFGGRIVTIEVDVRRGIPGTDIVGLAGAAVREARERVRASIRNAGFEYPRDRVLINLSPADVPKSGNHFDLGIAAALLEATGQGSGCVEESSDEELVGIDDSVILALGEVGLDGRVHASRGIVAAVIAAKSCGIARVAVPEANRREALAVGDIQVCGIEHIREWPAVERQLRNPVTPEKSYHIYQASGPHSETDSHRRGVDERIEAGESLDLQDIRGQFRMRRALEIAAAGRHHLLFVGPPGGGKTMAAARVPGVLPPLTKDHSLEVASVYSSIGETYFSRQPPMRSPHHSSSPAGIIGGSGREALPGEISLAHRGVLFLDEFTEFPPAVLQALREPLESGWVRLSRAGKVIEWPAVVQLIAASNLCPCGNLGRDSGRCMCSVSEVQRYWRRVGRALLDRIDIRCPVFPVSMKEYQGRHGESTEDVRARIIAARTFRTERNAEIASSDTLSEAAQRLKGTVATRLGLSGRAMNAITRIARTIADLERSEVITREALLEAVEHRRLGEREGIWQDWDRERRYTDNDGEVQSTIGVSAGR